MLANSKHRNEIFLITLLVICSAAMLLLKSDSLDTKLFYSAEFSQNFFNSLSEEQWRAYLFHELIDLFFFLPAYTCLTFLILKKLFVDTQAVWQAALMPGLFDLVETTCITAHLAKYLAEFPSWMGYITFAKWGTGIFVLMLILNGWLLKKLTKSSE